MEGEGQNRIKKGADAFVAVDVHFAVAKCIRHRAKLDAE
jgi:hypothetical protein